MKKFVKSQYLKKAYNGKNKEDTKGFSDLWEIIKLSKETTKDNRTEDLALKDELSWGGKWMENTMGYSLVNLRVFWNDVAQFKFLLGCLSLSVFT